MNKKIVISFILAIISIFIIILILLVFKAVKFLSSTPPEKLLKNVSQKVEKMTKEWIDYTRPDIDEYFKRYNNEEFEYICSNLIRIDKNDKPECVRWMNNLSEKYGKVSLYEIYKSKISKHIDFDVLETDYTIQVPTVYTIKGETKTKFVLLESKFKKLKIESIDVDYDD